MDRSFLFKGMRDALALVRREFRFLLRHRAGVRKARRLQAAEPLRLHMGSGGRGLPGWVNVDLREGSDLLLDVREPWPFFDGTAEIVFAEHVLEHLEYPGEATHFLGEALRVLRPGGVIRIGVPDSEWPVRSYSIGPGAEYFQVAKARWHPPQVETPMEHLNWHFRGLRGEHKYAYDWETIRKLLVACGFARINRVEFDPATDSERRRLGTLYVVAFKPSAPRPGD